MIRHFNASHPFKTYLMLTLSSLNLASTSHFKHKPRRIKHFREGALCTTPEGQEGCGRTCKLELRFSHLQMTVEVEITQGVSEIFYL